MFKMKRYFYSCPIALLLILMMAILFVHGNGNTVAFADQNSDYITELEQLKGQDIGCLSGSSYISDVNSFFDGCTVIEYNTYAELIAALKSKRIQAYIADEPMVHSQIRETDGLVSLNKMITKDRYGFIFNLNDTKLCNDINKVLGELTNQGVLDELKEKWISSESEPVFDTAQPWDKPNGVLRVGLALDSEPFAYLHNNETVGYDVELLYMIAEKLGYGIKITSYEFPSLIDSISAEKEDIGIGCITYTPERAENILFTNSTYESGTVAVVLSDTASSKSFWSKICDSFEKTFLRENRWQLVTNGLLVTIELSVLTLIFGTLAGFCFSFLLRSKIRAVRDISGIISTIIDGLPLLIILMVFYYILFAKTTLSAITIGVIGLSLEFANSVAGILNIGIETVDKGQTEAAESMGYSRWKIFTKIVFPQAVIRIFSQYIGAVTGMIKGTSIIGYITVVDLTKAGDIIRSHTYEAFFPLIAVALIYFALSQIIAAVLKSVSKKINPKHRKRQIKGVKMYD